MPLATEFETAPLTQAFAALTQTALEVRTNAACEATAKAIEREASSRLQRQIKGTSVPRKGRPDLGQQLLEHGIHAQPAYDGRGWVVLSDREPFPNVALWEEKGTRGNRRHSATAAEPYFYASIALEMGNHEQRLLNAMHDAAADTGLGT